MWRLLIVLIFCGFMFSACKKEENLVCTDKNTVKINQHALDYFYFKEGTWWVYEEETTGEIDSIWVTGGSKYYHNPWELKKYSNCNRGKCVEVAFVQFESEEHNWSNNNDFLYRYRIEAGWENGESSVSAGSGAYFSSSNTRLTYKSNKPVSPTGAEAVVINLDSVFVKDQTFNDIMYMYYPPESVGDWLQEAWYAKNIYLVKFKRSDSTTWSLVKYNIVK